MEKRRKGEGMVEIRKEIDGDEREKGKKALGESHTFTKCAKKIEESCASRTIKTMT